MKVAYIFRSSMASTFQLVTMILPQERMKMVADHDCS